MKWDLREDRKQLGSIAIYPNEHSTLPGFHEEEVIPQAGESWSGIWIKKQQQPTILAAAMMALEEEGEPQIQSRAF